MSPSLVINYAAASLPDDPWWLTTEVVSGDDRATIEDVATIVDTLYELNPCIETDAVQEDEPDQLDLFRAAQAVDLELCKLLRSGDYEAEVRVIRSHQQEPYKIIVDVGEIKQTVKVEEERTLTIDVQNVSELLLPYPVISGLRASWLGTVYGSNGVVVPPAINALHNTLFWDGSVSGTIRVQYRTTYDLVTVAVPGLLAFPEDQVGDPQSVNLLIFYHYQSYVDTIEPPPADPAIDDAFMAQICGWGTAVSSELLEEEEQPLAEPPMVEDPCFSPNDQLADPEYYKEKCCTPPPFGLPTCQAWIAGHKPGQGLDQATMNSYLASHNGPVSFIGVGNPGPEGCGEIIHRIDVSPNNCCDLVEPLVADPANPTEISSNSRVKMCVLGGGPILTWQVGGGLWFDNGSSTLITSARCVYVNAPENFCARSVINIDDGCSFLTTDLVKQDAIPLGFPQEDRIVAPESYIMLSPVGGLLPYTGWQSDKLIYVGDGTTGLFRAPTDFCGVATIEVMDQCMGQATCKVRSTDGIWVNDLNYIAETGGCTAPISTNSIVDGESTTIAEGYQLRSEFAIFGSYGTVVYPCSYGNTLGSAEAACFANGGEIYDTRGCCRWLDYDQSYYCLPSSEWGEALYTWECHA